MNAPLSLRLIARLTVPIDPPIEVGSVPGGIRRIIPIGTGVVDGPEIRGEVLPLGADWNLRRDDGTETVSARYLIRTREGEILSVLNEGVISVRDGEPFGVTSLRIEAPRDGAFAWLNDAVLVGSLEVVRDAGDVIAVSLEYWCAGPAAAPRRVTDPGVTDAARGGSAGAG
ncbi:DUF3237 domain-containing protein [Microbacterium aurantiacum]|uniref:DUF3237 domain-containing protein n=1 Tax=Microbacterium aurantiacum TaxID=162393 RepID=UPI00403736FE